jgi:hypothetical protein
MVKPIRIVSQLCPNFCNLSIWLSRWTLIWFTQVTASHLETTDYPPQSRVVGLWMLVGYLIYSEVKG